MNTEEIINNMVERIVARVHPEKIILFGSQARGDAGPESDIDLLVVMDDHVDRKTATIAMRSAVADSPMPKDIIITTPHEIATRGQLKSTVINAAMREGRVIYVR